jgi:molecular chaperone DnaJ
MREKTPAQDHYAILGVEISASGPEIKSAYKALILRFHPDRNKANADDAARKTQEIIAAYRVLSDPHSRASYDLELQRRRNAARSGRPGPGSAADGAEWRARQDARGAFYNRWHAQVQRRYEAPNPPPQQKRSYRPQDDERESRGTEREEIKLTFKQAMRGVTKSMIFAVGSTCRLCSGTGRIETEPPERCPGCRKKTVRAIALSTGNLFVCWSCGWSNTVIQTCPSCQGTGRMTGHRVRLVIPPGLDDGALLRHRLPAGMGDVLITVRVGRSRDFTRGEGADSDHLYTDLSIPRELAEEGGEAKVPTLDGMVTVRIPAGVKNGTQMRLANRGVKKRSGGFGDLYVCVRLGHSQRRSAKPTDEDDFEE